MKKMNILAVLMWLWCVCVCVLVLVLVCAVCTMRACVFASFAWATTTNVFGMNC